MHPKGLDPGMCGITVSYVSAEPYAGQIFGHDYHGAYSFRWVFRGQPLISVAGGSVGPASPACSTAACPHLLSVSSAVSTVHRGGGRFGSASQQNFSNWLGALGKGGRSVLWDVCREPAA